VPGHGFFLLSLDPGSDARFKSAGIVKENVLEFQYGPDQFRIQCTAAISLGIGRPVYVIAKPDATIQKVNFAAGDLMGRKW
jgi:hypothetical protein